MHTLSEPLNPNELDPGIRQTVMWLRSLGYATTDSGDGVTKFLSGDPPEGALDFPHVFIHVPAERAIEMADELWQTLQALKVDLPPGAVELSYAPADGIAIIALFNIGDADLSFTSKE